MNMNMGYCSVPSELRLNRPDGLVKSKANENPLEGEGQMNLTAVQDLCNIIQPRGASRSRAFTLYSDQHSA